MALETCPDCGHSVSEDAWTCPNCGARGPRERFDQKLGCGCVIVIAIAIALGLLYGQNEKAIKMWWKKQNQAKPMLIDVLDRGVSSSSNCRNGIR